MTAHKCESSGSHHRSKAFLAFKTENPHLFARTRTICGKCGYRIRGENHDSGRHHQSGTGGRCATPQYGW